MIKIVMLTICILLFIVFIMPFVVYSLVKWGMTGYYSAKRMWEKPHEDDNNEIKE